MVQGFSMLLKTKRHGREEYFSSYSPCPMISFIKKTYAITRGEYAKLACDQEERRRQGTMNHSTNIQTEMQLE